MGNIKNYILLAESESRTGNDTYEVESNNLSNGRFVIDITAGAGAGDTVVVTIEGYDKASGKWFEILESTTLNSNGTYQLKVSEFDSEVANESVLSFLPSHFRVRTTKNNATGITYSIGVTLSD